MFRLPSLLPNDLHSNIKKDIPNSVLDHLCYLWKVSTYYMQPSLVFSVSDDHSKESLRQISHTSSSSTAAIHLSHRLSRQFIELARVHHIQLPNTISERICTSCCVLLIPSITCNIRLRKRTRLSKVNRNSSNKERVKNQIIEKCSLCNYIKKLPGLVRRKAAELSLQSMNPPHSQASLTPHKTSSTTLMINSPTMITSNNFTSNKNCTCGVIEEYKYNNITKSSNTSTSTNTDTTAASSSCCTTNTFGDLSNNGRHNMFGNKMNSIVVGSKQNNKVSTNNNNNILQLNNIQKPKFSFLDSKKLLNDRRQSAPGKLMTKESDNYIPFLNNTTTSLFYRNNKVNNISQIHNRIDLDKIGLSRIQQQNTMNINNNTNTGILNSNNNESNEKELNLLELEELQKKKKRRHTILGNKSLL